MSFNDKNEDDGSQKALGSYSDLFAAISFIFLFLFIVENLNTQMNNVIQSKRLNKIINEKEDEFKVEKERLKAQIAILNTQEKNEEVEKSVYQELLDKIAKTESKRKETVAILKKAYQESTEREKDVSEFKELFVNVYSANQKLQDEVIEANKEKEKAIKEILITKEEKKREISNALKQFNEDFNKKRNILRKTLATKKLELEEAIAFKEQKLKKQLEDKKKKLKNTLIKREAELKKSISKREKRRYSKFIRAKAVEFKDKKRNLEQSFNKRKKLVRKRFEKELIKNRNSLTKKYERKIASIEGQYTKKIDHLKTKSSSKIKMIEQEKSRELLAAKMYFKKEVLKTKIRYSKNLKTLRMKTQQNVSGLKNASKSKHSKLIASIKSQENAIEELQKKDAHKNTLLRNVKEEASLYKGKFSKVKNKLAKVGEKEIITNKIANELRKAFKNNGFSERELGVISDNGDFQIPFKPYFFQINKYSLNKKMKKILKDVIPIYANSIFSNSKLSKWVKDIEIVGYSSPTFKTKYINPKNLTSKNQNAINYNLDLSYKRARSVYRYIFDKKKISFNYQNKLFLKTKVSGKSFMQENVKRLPAARLSAKKYCKEYNCYKQQKVIIRVNLK